MHRRNSKRITSGDSAMCFSMGVAEAVVQCPTNQ
jgi:hypothetical protein